jgi:type IV pilus assembly protein PilW
MKTPATRRHQRGMSLVELMVGVTIGLIVVAGAALAVSSQLSDNRRMLVETQLQQDLRASSDIVAHELRRAGALRDFRAVQGVWRSGMEQPTLFNDVAAWLDAGTAGLVIYQYQPTTGADTITGFVLEDGVLKQYLLGAEGAPTPQALTDGDVMEVTAFSVTVNQRPDSQLPCPKLCTGGGTACWPNVGVRELQVSITARAKRYPEVQRTMFSKVRLRNDFVQFADSGGNQICPQ